MTLANFFDYLYEEGRLRFVKNVVSQASCSNNNEPELTHLPAVYVQQPLVTLNRNIENRVNVIKPYLIGSLISWPAYWLHRSFQWQHHREKTHLPAYIRTTYYNAKILQAGIILMALVATMYTPLPVQEFAKEIRDDS